MSELTASFKSSVKELLEFFKQEKIDVDESSKRIDLLKKAGITVDSEGRRADNAMKALNKSDEKIDSLHKTINELKEDVGNAVSDEDGAFLDWLKEKKPHLLRRFLRKHTYVVLAKNISNK